MESVCIKMAGYASLPVWLLDSKESIVKSKEWNTFVRELYQAVDQQLAESHVRSYGELSEAERLMFVQRARQAVQNGLSYGNLYQHVSSILDRDLNRSVSRHQLQGASTDTKSDLILDSALDGSVGLLKKWPDLRSKLHVFLNQPLPPHLQPIAWRLFLEDSTLRTKYEQAVSSKSKSLVAPAEIRNRCEEMLKEDSLLGERLESAGGFEAMKSVLSYYQNVNGMKGALHQSYYNLFIPFVMVNSQLLQQRKESAPADVVTLLAEEYFTFTASLPQFVHASIAQVNDPAIDVFTSRVQKSLQKISRENCEWIVGSPLTKETVRSKKQSSSSKATASRATSSESFRNLALQLVQNMFVGYANKEVLLYIWDQYIIGLDSAGFTDDYLPVITAVFLNLAAERLKSQTEVEVTSENLAREGKKFTVMQFQSDMDKHFYKELFARLQQEARAAVPVMDPTRGTEHRWSEWFDDPPVNRAGPRDRRQAVEVANDEKKESISRREENLSAPVREERVITRTDRRDDGLADRLKQERKRREDGEQIAADEIDRLRRELDVARRLREQPNSDSPASVILVPPPPTAIDQIWPELAMPEHRRVTPQIGEPRKDARQASIDLLKRISRGFNRLAHGDGYLKEQLDDTTKKSLAVHRDDLKKAEAVIFGRELKPKEFQELPQSVRNLKTQEMLEIIRKRIIERRKQQLNTSFA